MKLNILIKHKLSLLFTLLTIIMLNMNFLQAQTISVCDNGGFEQDFLYYNGEIAKYYSGSSSCRPKDSGGQPVVFSSASLPTPRRIEIVTSGIDTLVGINRTKFGSKALRLNYKHGHDTIDCDGSHGIDKIVKQFTVTEDNRNFTVWYALVVENPTDHINTQPFLNIQCDLDPANELCFDAKILNCANEYTDSICGDDFDPIDVLNWACHRFIIPKSEIGNIATLEITAADCGQGAHFGYAYIDGICEECTGSVLGSVRLNDVKYCHLDSATICGNYTLPNICGQNWTIKELTVPNYQIHNLVIDEASKTFCFDFPISNFGNEDCLDIFVDVVFTNGNFDLQPQMSNYVEVCKSNYQTYLSFVQVGTCHNNETTINLSDDYYYVLVGIQNTGGSAWTIDRQLSDPYPNESGLNEISSSSGDATVTLGPFRIQEGEWTLILMINDCIYEELIVPPDYCGDCPDYNLLKIDNIQCSQGTTDTWSFDIEVLHPTGVSYDLWNIDLNFRVGTYTFNSSNPIGPLPLLPTCSNYRLDGGPTGCEASFIICPPKPCSSACDIEVFIDDVPCEEDLVTGNVTFDIEIDVTGTGPFFCYSVMDASSKQVIDGGSLPNPQKLGTYGDDVFVSIYSCTDPNCNPNNCDVAICFKTFYVPLPDCNVPTAPYLVSNDIELHKLHEIKIYPNPIISNEVHIQSTFSATELEVLNAYGKIINTINFEGDSYKFTLNGLPGLYFLRYKSDNNQIKLVKLIKL